MSDKRHDTHMLTIREMAANTPDFVELKHMREDEFLIFVVGTMKRNKDHHITLTGANYYGKGITTGTNYLLKKTAPNAAPILFDLSNRWTKKGALIPPHMVGSIEGEVYGVPLRAITKIDIIEDNGTATKRMKRYVNLIEQTGHSKCASCFVWLADRDFWEDVVENIINLPGVSQKVEGNNRRFYY